MAWVERMSSRISACCLAIRSRAGGPLFQEVPVVGAVDVGGPDLDAMLDGVPDDLRRGIETHRLAVEQGAGEDIGIVALEPARGIDEEREGGGVALGKAIFAEPLDLREAALGEILGIAVADHARDEFLGELGEPAIALPGGHGAAELVGLAGREAGADDGDLHRLLLEQRHAEGAAEHGLELGLGKDHLFLASAGAAGRDAPCRPGSARDARSPPR